MRRSNFSDVFNVLDFPFLFPSNEKFEKVIGTDAFYQSEFVFRPAEQDVQIVQVLWRKSSTGA